MDATYVRSPTQLPLAWRNSPAEAVATVAGHGGEVGIGHFQEHRRHALDLVRYGRLE